MPVVEDVSEALIRESIVSAVANVFDRMLRRPATLRRWACSWPARPSLELDDGAPHVVGSVGFHGEARGLIHLHFESTFAVDCTGIILGMAGPELSRVGDVVVNYAVSELTKMIVEEFRASFGEAGYHFGLTDASILRGRNFRIDPIVSAQSYVYIFDCAGSCVAADVLLTDTQ